MTSGQRVPLQAALRCAMGLGHERHSPLALSLAAYLHSCTLMSRIGGVLQINSTALDFWLDDGMKLHIVNGRSILDFGDGKSVQVCAAEVACSALMVNEKDVRVPHPLSRLPLRSPRSP